MRGEDLDLIIFSRIGEGKKNRHLNVRFNTRSLATVGADKKSRTVHGIRNGHCC